MKEKIKVCKIYTNAKVEIIEIKNELKAFQAEVGGYIETVTFTKNGKTLIVICDEEGLLKEKKVNCTIYGNPFLGDILIVGDAGEDFTDIPLKELNDLLKENYVNLEETDYE